MILLLVGVVQAAGFEVPWQSARVSGMGGAGTALSEDAAAAWYNPAALADGGGLRVAAGLSVASAHVQAEALPESPDAPWESRTEGPPGLPPYAALSYARGRFAGSLALNAAYAGGVSWPEDWPYRFDILSSKPTFFRVSPAVAARLGPVQLAVGAHLDAGSLSVLKATDHISEEGQAELLLRGRGLGVDAALYAPLGQSAALGLSYKSRTQLALAGEADFDVPSAFAAMYPDQAVSADWTLPDRLALGGAFWHEQWRVSLDGSLSLWSVNDNLSFDFSDSATPDLTQENLWRNSFALRAGVERGLGRFAARGGLAFDGLPGAPPPASTLSPSSPDCTRISLTLGGSADLSEELALDVFYEHMTLLPRDSESEDAPLARYSGSANVAGLGLRWR